MAEKTYDIKIYYKGPRGHDPPLPKEITVAGWRLGDPPGFVTWIMPGGEMVEFWNLADVEKIVSPVSEQYEQEEQQEG